MKLAISNLAWNPEEDDDVRSLLVARGVQGIELAPMKYWPDPRAVRQEYILEAKARWEAAGISIVALQGIFFGLQLQLFSPAAQQQAFVSHFREMSRLARLLGAGVIVFGAPRNRLRGSLSPQMALTAARSVLRRVAENAVDNGVTIAIEPNPERYGGDFITNSAEARELVSVVDHAGFGLHMDAGATAINNESDDDILASAELARHFHVSEVDLAPVGSGSVNHDRLAGLLRRAHYSEWCSIEMLAHTAASSANVLQAVTGALDVAEAYSH